MFALIWDLDGTLTASYEMIVPSLRQYYAERGLDLAEDEIRRRVLRTSVGAFAAEIKQETGIRLEDGSGRYREIRSGLERNIRPVPHAPEVLAALNRAGVRNYLYTHRGATTAEVLARTGMADAFAETVTAENGFARKPAPDGVRYLIGAHGLDPARTLYVGDRQLDVDCAHNAGIRCILYHPEAEPPVTVGPDDVVIRDLRELPTLLSAGRLLPRGEGRQR